MADSWQQQVVLVQQGNPAAFDRIVEHFEDMAVGYAYSLLGDFQLAEDAAQEAFLEAYFCLANLQHPGAFPAWFRKIVFKQCDRITRRKQHLTIPLESTVEMPCREPSPLETVMQQETQESVLSAINALPQLERTVTSLAYINGYSLAEVGDFLDVPVSTVKNRLHTARKQLKERMVGLVEETMRSHAPGDDFRRQVAKVLENIHNLVTFNYGQNYFFDGCMHYLMECMHADTAYDYWFFSGVTGDSFTQLYRTDSPHWPVDSLSHDAFDEALARRAFAACGYDFHYVPQAEVTVDKVQITQQIIACIDKGLPIITHGFGLRIDPGGFENLFAVICGYENGGDTFLVLKGADTTPTPTQNLLEHTQGLLFVGEKRPSPPLAQVYREAVLRIPALMTMLPKDGLLFGKQAFEAWADGLLDDELFAATDEAALGPLGWRMHLAPLIIAGTNGCARGFLAKAFELNPDMGIILQLLPVYERMHVIFEEIQVMQGGFWISSETLKDTNARRAIAEKIRECGQCCDEIVSLFALPG